jgi:hypothetical protein
MKNPLELRWWIYSPEFKEKALERNEGQGKSFWSGARIEKYEIARSQAYSAAPTALYMAKARLGEVARAVVNFE